jgi:hypothetical protein
MYSLPLANPELSASVIATVDSTTFEYIDYDISSGSEYIYYFVRAYNSGSQNVSSRTNIESTTGSVNKRAENIEISELDSKFGLLDNYPNPFNPSTTISYQIPENGHVTLKVYNTLGKEVAVLEDGFKEAGNYDVVFNVENLPSGMYFYSITAGTYSETKKMILLK